MKLIDKDTLVAEIESYKNSFCDRNGYLEDRETNGLAYDTLCELEDSIDNLEVKEVDTWHLQEKEDIYDAVKDWGLYTFVCIMKDGTIQRFNGNLDEDCEGHIHVHVNGVNDDYDNVDDILKWIELT